MKTYLSLRLVTEESRRGCGLLLVLHVLSQGLRKIHLARSCVHVRRSPCSVFDLRWSAPTKNQVVGGSDYNLLLVAGVDRLRLEASSSFLASRSDATPL